MTLLERFRLLRRSGRKALAVLIDPEKNITSDHIRALLGNSGAEAIDCLLVGGSTATPETYISTIRLIRRQSDIPVVLFPAHPAHLCDGADAVLLLSLISGRNPDLLIGHHIDAARRLQDSRMELLPTGYILVGDDEDTAVARVSGCRPIPVLEKELAASTALAGEMLGLQLIYLEAGSGANRPVNPEIIRSVRKLTSVPILAGGGIRTAAAAQAAWESGADIVVIGNALEQDPGRIEEFTNLPRQNHPFPNVNSDVAP